MSESNRQYIFLEIVKELIWWIISAVVATAIMLPLISKLHYKPMWINGTLIVIALTYFRYCVFLRTTYILQWKWVRFALVVFNVNFFVFVLRKMQSFMYLYDSFTLDAIGTPLKTLAPEDVDPLFRYFFDEINLTCVAAMSLSIVLIIRIIMAHWKTAYMRLNAGSEE
jgi:hypothetical protein